MNLEVVGGVDTEDEYELVDILVCPLCGGDHPLISCRHVKMMTFEYDDITRWTHVEFFRKPDRPSWWSRHFGK